jgi:Ran GTPase-activating protein (RanGAP) involved in mRNA processing and transport
VQVETLKMGWCHVGADAGAKAVADLLMFNSSLAVLDLRGNGLGNAGAAHLARSLKEHTNDKLTELDLGYNEIKDEGACTLAQVRCRLPPLVVCEVFDWLNKGQLAVKSIGHGRQVALGPCS